MPSLLTEQDSETVGQSDSTQRIPYVEVVLRYQQVAVRSARHRY